MPATGNTHPSCDTPKFWKEPPPSRPRWTSMGLSRTQKSGSQRPQTEHGENSSDVSMPALRPAPVPNEGFKTPRASKPSKKSFAGECWGPRLLPVTMDSAEASPAGAQAATREDLCPGIAAWLYFSSKGSKVGPAICTDRSRALLGICGLVYVLRKPKVPYSWPLLKVGGTKECYPSISWIAKNAPVKSEPQQEWRRIHARYVSAGAAHRTGEYPIFWSPQLDTTQSSGLWVVQPCWVHARGGMPLAA